MARGKKVFYVDLDPNAKNVKGQDYSSCAAHALASVLDCPYHTAQTITFAQGRRQNEGTYVFEMMEWINRLYPADCPLFIPAKFPHGIRVYDFLNLQTSPHSRYFCCIRGHAIAIIKQKVVDTTRREADIYPLLGKRLVSAWALNPVYQYEDINIAADILFKWKVIWDSI